MSIDRRRVLATSIAAAGLLTAAGVALTAGLGGLARRRGLSFGAAIRSEQLRDEPDLREAVLAECGALTPEVELNWSALEPAYGFMGFANLDDLAAFSLQATKPLCGHTLLWHKAMPGWATQSLNEAPDWRLIERYFASVLPRYADVIPRWHVVNEPIDVGDRADGLRRTVLLDAFGPDYIHRALEQARALAPRALLFLNEYSLEYDFAEERERRTALLKLAERLMARGAPLDGVGLQSHLDLSKGSVSQAAVSTFVRALGDLGLAVAVTELDVKEADYVAPQAQRDVLVADEVRRYLDAVLAEPNVIGVTTWGLTDRHSWLTVTEADHARFPAAWRQGDGPGFNRGLPLDSSMRPKPMYAAIASALRAAPERPAFKSPRRSPDGRTRRLTAPIRR
ncbi:MAG TPA: endo-1,4-beta-xylanase [Caulobacteraceae bacterium]|nr:endo-1,4-beta-xylanase [Caulobacteraceae bacterium]